MADNNGFVVAAFVVTWVVVIGYQVRLARLARRARQALQDAERRTS